MDKLLVGSLQLIQYIHSDGLVDIDVNDRISHHHKLKMKKKGSINNKTMKSIMYKDVENVAQLPLNTNVLDNRHHEQNTQSFFMNVHKICKWNFMQTYNWHYFSCTKVMEGIMAIQPQTTVNNINPLEYIEGTILVDLAQKRTMTP